MEEACQAGKLRAIGVSNFERGDLDNLLENGTIKPMVNQILAHVGNTPFDLIDYSRSKDILVEAYSPVAHGAVLNNAHLADMAEKYGVGVAQLCIRYCLQLGLIPLPKTLNAQHLRSNAAVDFVISEGDMAALKNVDGTDYGQASAFPVFGKKRQVAEPAYRRSPQ
jgi:diketogulonate reductase-like aldo/keto reductase